MMSVAPPDDSLARPVRVQKTKKRAKRKSGRGKETVGWLSKLSPVTQRLVEEFTSAPVQGRLEEAARDPSTTMLRLTQLCVVAAAVFAVLQQVGEDENPNEAPLLGTVSAYQVMEKIVRLETSDPVLEIPLCPPSALHPGYFEKDGPLVRDLLLQLVDLHVLSPVFCCSTLRFLPVDTARQRGLLLDLRPVQAQLQESGADISCGEIAMCAWTLVTGGRNEKLYRHLRHTCCAIVLQNPEITEGRLKRMFHPILFGAEVEYLVHGMWREGLLLSSIRISDGYPLLSRRTPDPSLPALLPCTTSFSPSPFLLHRLVTGTLHVPTSSTAGATASSSTSSL